MNNKFGELRPIDRLDLASLERLHDWFQKDVEDFVSEERTRLYVLEEGEENVIGFIAFSAQDENIAEIKRIVVDKDYNDDGFKEVLFEKGLHLAKLARCDKLIVIVDEAHESMIKFVQSKKSIDKPKLKKNCFSGRDAYEFIFNVVDTSKMRSIKISE